MFAHSCEFKKYKKNKSENKYEFKNIENRNSYDEKI